MAIAESEGWPQIAKYSRDVDSARDYEVVWQVESATVHYLESYLTGDCAAVGIGADIDSAEIPLRMLDRILPGAAYEQDELLDRVEMETEDRELAGSLIRAGLGAPLSSDDDYFEVMTRFSTEHPNPRIRQFALCGIVYIEWPEFVPLLRRISTDDPAESVRTRAAVVLDAYRAAGMDDS